jgi:Leucine-rich repeat (LRR) protein
LKGKGLAGGFFSEKELIVLTRLFSDMRAASAKLSPDHRDRVPTKAAFETVCQTNSLDGWSEQAAVVRKAALVFQCDPKVEPVFRLTLTDFLHPVLAKINQDNDIPVFELAPDDLVPPRDEALEHLQALEALKFDLGRFERDNAVLLAENKALREQIETLKAALADAARGTRSFISIFSNNKYWSDNKDSPFSVSVGDGLVEALIGILHIKEIRDALGNSARRTVSTGKAFFGRLGRWAEANAIESIERGAAQRIEAFGRLEAQLALPAPDAPTPDGIFSTPPADFDMAEVHAMILRGERPKASWRPFIKLLNFGDNEKFGDLSPVSGLSALEQLSLDNTQVSDLSPVSGLSALTWLSLNNTQVSDLSPVSGLSALTWLSVDNTQVSDLSSVSRLSALTELWLNNTQVSDLSPLAGLNALTGLLLSNTQVSDLSPVSGLSALERLSLDNTQVSDLSPVSGLSALTELSLDNTQVSDLSPVSGLSALTWLSLNSTQVSNLSPVSGLSALTGFWLNNTQVSDLSPVSGLSVLTWLALDNTQVSDLSSVSGLNALERLWLNNTQVRDLSPLSGLSGLTELWLNNTQVSDAGPLAGLNGLGELSLALTFVTDLSPLAGLTGLEKLYLGISMDKSVSVLDHLEHLTIIGGPAPRDGKPRPE